MKIWRFLTLNGHTLKPFMTFLKRYWWKSFFVCLKLSILSLYLTPSFSSLFLPHTHTYIYIFIYTHTQSRLLCWVGWVVESLWGGLSALIGFWSTPLSFPFALSHCATACLSLPTHSIHSVCVCVCVWVCVCVCVSEEAYSAFYLFWMWVGNSSSSTQCVSTFLWCLSRR